MPASRKRKFSTPNSAEDQISLSRGKRKKDSQTTAKKTTRRKTRMKKKWTTKDAEECGVKSVTLTLKSVLPLCGHMENACLVFLAKGQKVCIKGLAQIKTLIGSAEVYGSVIEADHNPVEIFSPCTSSLVVLSECSRENSSIGTNLKRTLQDALQSQPSEVTKKALVRAKKAATVLVMKSLQTVETAFVCGLQSFHDIFSLDLGKFTSLDKTELSLKKKTAALGFILLEPDSTRCRVLTVSDQWKAVDYAVHQGKGGTQEVKAPVILICGGKDIGKSTFARYLTNSLLNSQKELYFLECDVGQTEFTPPGLISLNKVSSPVLGPPFTHLRQPERSVFFGDVSPKDKPGFYIQCIHSVYQTYADNYRNKVPLIVNTQGWVKGMGVPLLLDVIRMVQPTHIIQFNHDAEAQANKNLPKITDDFLMNTPGWAFTVDEEQELANNHRDGILSPENIEESEIEKSRLPFDPVVLEINTCESNGDTLTMCKFGASDHRTLALLSYFSRTGMNNSHCEEQRRTSLLSCIPYSVPWNCVAIHVMHTELSWNQILFSVNASIVGLAESTSDQMYRREEDSISPYFLTKNPIVECIGLGIVRNIDPVKRVLYVVTPLSIDDLQQANTLLKGNLEIPAALLLSTKQVNVPYVSTEFSYDLRGAGARKVRYNLMRRKNARL